MTKKLEKRDNGKESKTKKDYRAPRLSIYGDIRELTLSAGDKSPIRDKPSGGTNKTS